MSLEDQLAKLTAAVEKQNSLMEKMFAGQKPAATTGGAGKPADKPADKPAASGKPAGKAADKKPKEITDQDLVDAATNFLKVADPDEKANRKAQMGRIIAHFGAARFSTIEPEHRADAMKFLKGFEAGEEQDFDQTGDPEDEGEDASDMV